MATGGQGDDDRDGDGSSNGLMEHGFNDRGYSLLCRPNTRRGASLLRRDLCH